ncbi:hypothetical protein [Streptomyces indicus]|uniref:Uncharacterized protein n=1 Tax=Streptomyces indicus TaxID=417292 RepID=A0A1G9ITC4_9ACTN|nr:hypothetical protein [Streptomyces indicus]SDL28361.1 hypothetical protein SAMN05421806_12555 [Streptomyces indicus]
MGWKQTSDALNDALDARDEAARQFGENSPEWAVADEQALDALRAHEKNSDQR